MGTPVAAHWRARATPLARDYLTRGIMELIRSSALLLIDVQQGIDDPRSGARNNPGAERQIATLLTAWREAGWPVIHVQHMSVIPGSALRPAAPGNAFKPEAEPLPGEPVRAAGESGHA